MGMTQNLGTQAISWAFFGSEVICAVYDLRWAILFTAVLILTDFWWGWRENIMHCRKATTEEERAKYKFRFSTAGRRTLNKFIDYTTYLLVGCVAGFAITEPLGICSHNVTASIGLGFGCLFELSSIVGHIAAVKGIKIRLNLKSLIVALVKKKDESLGEIFDEGIEDIKDENQKEDNP